jgi:hypothetical protein
MALTSDRAMSAGRNLLHRGSRCRVTSASACAHEEPAIAVCEFDAPTQLAPQNNQLMSERGIFGLKPDLRLEWRGQGSQDETQKPDHSAQFR